MKTTLLLLFCASMLAWPAGAAPVELGSLKLRDGRELAAVKVLKVEPDGLRVEHRDGVGKVRMEDLPAEVAQRFNLDETTASAWRQEEKKRQDEAAEARRQVESRILAETARSEQDTQARNQRLAVFDQNRSPGVNYAQLDEQLLSHIRTWKDAGRPDLAARFEEDRQLLKQQEIARPAGEFQAEREALARRVQDLQNELNILRQQPSTTTTIVSSDPFPNRNPGYYSDYTPGLVPPVWYPPVTVPYCPPTVVRPPVSVRPPMAVLPATRPMNQGNPIHGSHLWKK
jgi:hypothetical protein